MTGKHVAITVVGLIACFVVVVAVGAAFRKEPYFTRDLYQAQLKIETRVPLGCKLADVLEYVKRHFDAYRYDEQHRCLVARYTVYSGGKSRRAEMSMRTFFYFDSETQLTRIKHRNSFSPETLLSPEEEALRALDCLPSETRKMLKEIAE